MDGLVYNVFCSQTAKGNPCGIMFLNHWPKDEILQQYAQSLAQPVTSFLVEEQGCYAIRWFSLVGEINLCGHGSLGAGAALIDRLSVSTVTLNSQYGDIVINQQGLLYQMELPSWKSKPYQSNSLAKDLELNPVDMFTTRDLVVVLESEEEVLKFKPNTAYLNRAVEQHAFILTALRSPTEYVLRYFAPKIGILEDIATGSAQCSLAPYWFKKQSKNKLQATQLSEDG